MRRKIFIFLMLLIGIVSILYTGWLIGVIKTKAYPVFYIYLRFFLVGWVISSIIIALIGETKKIGGVKAFFISLFNPALGIIIVLASDAREKRNIATIMNRAEKINFNQATKTYKNKAYTLNN